jgi:hypothetical protein
MVVHTSFFKSESAELLRNEGRAEGEAEFILRALTRRGIEVSDAVRDRVTACSDLATLARWFDRALTATVAEDIFAEG